MIEKETENKINIELERNKELYTELTKFKKEANENWILFIKSKAELENLKKKIEKDINNEIKNSNKKIFTELLPILDSLESCINNEKNKSSHTGMLLLHKMFIKTLNKNDIKKIETKKYDDFDPIKHEAISIIKNNLYDNKISNIFQSGYMLQNHVIRYSKVSVFEKE